MTGRETGETMRDERVARVPLTDAVHDRILELIMDGTLAPGEPLRVQALASRLGVSQTPVRESLGRLAGSQLVVRAPMRGYAVAPLLTEQEVVDLMETRLLLESEMAAQAVGADGLDDALRENLERSRRVEVGATYEHYREYLELSAEFHTLIAEACRNRFLRAAFDSLPIHVQRFRLFGADGVDDVDESLAEHDAVRAALASGDPAEARRAVEAHIRGVEARSRRMLER